MEKVAPNSKFVWQCTKIIWQSKIKGPIKDCNLMRPRELNTSSFTKFFKD